MLANSLGFHIQDTVDSSLEELAQEKHTDNHRGAPREKGGFKPITLQ